MRPSPPERLSKTNGCSAGSALLRGKMLMGPDATWRFSLKKGQQVNISMLHLQLALESLAVNLLTTVHNADTQLYIHAAICATAHCQPGWQQASSAIMQPCKSWHLRDDTPCVRTEAEPSTLVNNLHAQTQQPANIDADATNQILSRLSGDGPEADECIFQHVPKAKTIRCCSVKTVESKSSQTTTQAAHFEANCT
jgi:hypothetical protein